MKWNYISQNGGPYWFDYYFFFKDTIWFYVSNNLKIFFTIYTWNIEQAQKIKLFDNIIFYKYKILSIL